jgi:hypothetical protein
VRILRFVLLAAASMIPAAAPCQESEPVYPGTPLDTTFIRAGIDSLAILVERGDDTVRAGTWVLDTRIHSAPGGRRITRVQRVLIGAHPDTVPDVAHLHWQTLLPDSAQVRGEVPYDFFFEPMGVRIVSLEDSSTAELALESPVFYAGTMDLLLRALPLRVGYGARFPVLRPDGEQDEVYLRVTGEESVATLDGGACTSLVVEVGFTGDGETYRIATATRDLVRIDSRYSTTVRSIGCP